MYFLKDLVALERLVQKEIDNHHNPGGSDGEDPDDQGEDHDDQGDNP